MRVHIHSSDPLDLRDGDLSVRYVVRPRDDAAREAIGSEGVLKARGAMARMLALRAYGARDLDVQAAPDGTILEARVVRDGSQTSVAAVRYNYEWDRSQPQHAQVLDAVAALENEGVRTFEFPRGANMAGLLDALTRVPRERPLAAVRAEVALRLSEDRTALDVENEPDGHSDFQKRMLSVVREHEYTLRRIDALATAGVTHVFAHGYDPGDALTVAEHAAARRVERDGRRAPDRGSKSRLRDAVGARFAPVISEALDREVSGAEVVRALVDASNKELPRGGAGSAAERTSAAYRDAVASLVGADRRADVRLVDELEAELRGIVDEEAANEASRRDNDAVLARAADHGEFRNGERVDALFAKAATTAAGREVPAAEVRAALGEAARALSPSFASDMPTRVREAVVRDAAAERILGPNADRRGIAALAERLRDIIEADQHVGARTHAASADRAVGEAPHRQHAAEAGRHV